MKINGAVLSYLTFSDGCVHVDVSPHRHDLESCSVVRVDVEYGDSFELIIMALDAIRRINRGHVRLWFDYLPYARQDRVCASGQAAAKQAYLNALEYQLFSFDSYEIHVVDVHSTDGYPIGMNIINHPVQQLIPNQLLNDVVLVAPDRGAIMRVLNVAKFSGNDVIYFEKHRNPSNGVIESISTTYDLNSYAGRRFLIIDDICDDGGTFVPIIKQLSAMGRVDMWITHGIFAKGVGLLFGAGLHTLHTTDTIPSTGNYQDVVIHQIEGLLPAKIYPTVP